MAGEGQLERGIYIGLMRVVGLGVMGSWVQGFMGTWAQGSGAHGLRVMDQGLDGIRGTVGSGAR